MRLRLAFLLLVFIAAGSFFGVAARGGQQQGAAPAQGKFTSSTSIVLVPVLVDSDHQPVLDLKASDFEVLDNGKAQTLASFEPPDPNARKQPAVTGGSEFSNLDAVTPRHLAIIALDAQNTSPGSKPFARDAVTRFLSTAVSAGDRVAVIVLQSGGFRVIHDFSQDPLALRRATEKVRMGANLAPLEPMGPGTQTGSESGDLASTAINEAVKVMETNTQQTQEESNEGMTADSMRAVAKAFGPIPGRKSLIWVTDAFRRRQDAPVLSGSRVSAESGRGTSTMIFDTVFRSLNDANIAVYPVDTRGLYVLIPESGARAEGVRTQLEQKDENVDTMLWFAQETGGKAAWGRNDIQKAIERAFADSDYTYLLSYRLPADAKKGWHTLTVKVKRSGTHVVARTGFNFGGASQSGEQELAGALRTPFVYNSLPMMVRWAGIVPGSNGKKLVTFQLAIPPGALSAENTHLELDLRAVARDAQMKPAGDVSRKIAADLTPDKAAKVATGGFSYTAQIELAPGEYTVNFAIRDNVTGRIGSLHAPLKLD
jgi:VWFA-related protein